MDTVDRADPIDSEALHDREPQQASLARGQGGDRFLERALERRAVLHLELRECRIVGDHGHVLEVLHPALEAVAVLQEVQPEAKRRDPNETTELATARIRDDARDASHLGDEQAYAQLLLDLRDLVVRQRESRERRGDHGEVPCLERLERRRLCERARAREVELVGVEPMRCSLALETVHEQPAHGFAIDHERGQGRGSLAEHALDLGHHHAPSCHDASDLPALRPPYTVPWHDGGVRILVVEDEAALRDGIVDLLTGDGHEVTPASDGVMGLEAGLRDPFDVVVLDLMMPRLDGMEVCRRLRAARPGTPILMLTARGSEDDKVRGLMEGADDYVTKPFSARELLARVRVLGRRTPQGESLDEVQVDGATIDLARMVVVRGDVRTTLTPREVGIVRWLFRHQERVVTRAELLEQVFGQRGDLQTRAVDMAIAVLRKKVELDPAKPTLIVSVKGAGYAWRLTR